MLPDVLLLERPRQINQQLLLHNFLVIINLFLLKKLMMNELIIIIDVGVAGLNRLATPPLQCKHGCSDVFGDCISSLVFVRKNKW